jgi:hypothetical protein
MTSQSESTFGAKVQNAQNLVTHLKTFVDYKPLRPTDTVDELNTLLTSLTQADSVEANKLQNYSLIVETRQQLFDKSDDSLKKSLTSIVATTRAMYGKDSKEAQNINELIKKLRGGSKAKTPKKADEKTISTSQQSFASVTQGFSDLIASLGAFTPAFAPANESIALPNLQTKLEAIRQSNTDVVSILGELNQARNTRNKLYDDLKDRCQHIKEAVKAQYGIKSMEYAAIKGLKI